MQLQYMKLSCILRGAWCVGCYNGSPIIQDVQIFLHLLDLVSVEGDVLFKYIIFVTIYLVR